MRLHPIAIAALTGVMYTQPAAAQTFFDLAGEADKAISESRWSDAAEIINEAIGLNPANPNNILLMSNLGIVYYNMGADSLAIATLDEAHRRAPKSVTVLNNRAEVLGALGHTEKAMRDLEAVMQLDSTLLHPRYLHAMMAIGEGDKVTALADTEYLLRHAPDDIETLFARATALSANNRWEDAVAPYTALIERQPSAELYCGRAVCYLMLERLNDASADINSGLQLDPDNRELYFYRAHLNKMRYQPDAAREDMKKALRTD